MTFLHSITKSQESQPWWEADYLRSIAFSLASHHLIIYFSFEQFIIPSFKSLVEGKDFFVSTILPLSGLSFLYFVEYSYAITPSYHSGGLLSAMIRAHQFILFSILSTHFKSLTVAIAKIAVFLLWPI